MPAPPLFSTKTCWPHILESLSASMRATMSGGASRRNRHDDANGLGRIIKLRALRAPQSIDGRECPARRPGRPTGQSSGDGSTSEYPRSPPRWRHSIPLSRPLSPDERSRPPPPAVRSGPAAAHASAISPEHFSVAGSGPKSRATFRGHDLVRSHDLIRKVCNFSGSCSHSGFMLTVLRIGDPAHELVLEYARGLVGTDVAHRLEARL